MIDIKNIILTLCLLIFTASMTVSLPLYAGSFPNGTSGPYFVLLSASTSSTIIYGLLFLVMSFFTKSTMIPLNRQNVLLFVIIGGFSTLNGILLVYASPPNRTPPILQGFLLETSFIWTIIGTKLFVKEKSSYDYCECLPVMSLVGVFDGIVISLLPTIINIIENGNGISGASNILWAFILLLGLIPAALGNVFIERLLKNRIHSDTTRNSFYDLMSLLFWTSLVQVIGFLLLFWVDIIPGFGFSPDLDHFLNIMVKSTECFFGGCTLTPLYGGIFIFSFITVNLFVAALSEESANYQAIASLLGTPVTTIFWLIFPQLNPDQSSTPLWSVIPALGLLFLSTVMWKYWEKRQAKRLREGRLIQ
eukprot:TRINITY_DN6717_c0_g1_i1.p1 TRINITY_DN6717_c0_g1~~TRINITY_DN6717_c0_g1_i1.p1  ORF type:complete len:377 (-),score=44.90 TRINITY_DN6717_c0_g1_i1:5-1093(-)